MTAATAATAPDVLNLPAGVVLHTEHDLAGGTATAVFSPDDTYRYLLTRRWDAALPIACWIMLNPSTATATTTDPTLTRVVQFTADAGCGGLMIVNLFALRSTDPRALRDHKDPVGPHNDLFLRRAAREATGPVIAAWGAQGTLHDRHTAVLNLLNRDQTDLRCYGTTRDISGRQPRHPLYLRGTTTLTPYRPTIRDTQSPEETGSLPNPRPETPTHR